MTREAPKSSAEDLAAQAFDIEAKQELWKRAKKALADRRRRVQIFGAGMFGEAAWDMLLVLYIERYTTRHTITRLVNATGAAPTTVLRWLTLLTERDLVRRRSSNVDSRAVIVELTDKAERLLDLYFSGTAKLPE